MSLELPSNKETILDEPDIKELIRSRDIKPEDFHFLIELAPIPKRLLILDFHNFFGVYKERSEAELKNMIRHLDGSKEPITDLENRKKLHELMLDFLQKYNWAVAWNLVVVFERRKHEQHHF